MRMELTIALALISILMCVNISGDEKHVLAIKEGVDFEKVIPAQPTGNTKKVEVIEFFWYGCPHCYKFEPELKAWLKTKPQQVEFIRQPAVFSPKWAHHAKAYFVAEALGVIDKIHDDFFDAIQNKKRSLDTEDDLARFFVEHGVNEDNFRKTFKSFAVDAKMRQAEGMSARYGVTGVPAIIVNGKYRTNGPLAKNFPHLIQIMDGLIAQESK